MAVLWIIFAIAVQREREDTVQRARQQAENIATVLHRDIRRNLEILNLSLEAICANWADPAIVNLPAAVKRGVLFDGSLKARNISNAVVLDAKGTVIFTLAGEDIMGQNFSDRAYFRSHMGTFDGEVHISKVLSSRITGKKIVALSKRINKEFGASQGVAVLYLDTDYFDELADGLNLGANGSFSIKGPQGDTLTSLKSPAQKGKSFEKLYQSLIVKFSRAAEPENIIIEDMLHSSGIHIFVELSKSDIFDPWWRRTWPIAVAVFILSLALMGLVTFSGFLLNARRSAESRLRNLASTDVLTGLENRRSVEMALRNESSHLSGEPLLLSILFIDIDLFKKINDVEGHGRGDEVLREVALVIQKCVSRPGDRVARYGGEEFLVVLPQTELSGALVLSEKIRSSVENTDISHPTAQEGKVTVSIGAACYDPQMDGDVYQIIRRADEALYRAKADGRNRVRI